MHPDFTTADLARLAAIPLLPLVAFFVQVLVGRFLPRKGDWIPTGAMGIAAVLGIYELVKVLGAWDPDFRVLSAAYGKVFTWIPGSSKTGPAAFGILYDNLAAVMTAAVALISFLIHLFSVGYMRGDRRYATYFANLSLFSFGMLGLVLSDNFLSLFVCWEVMGLCSYLLIGHFYERPAAAAACKKAFLTTRLGDVCLFLGIAMLWKHYGTLRFDALYEAAANDVAMNGFPAWLVVAGLLIFGGAVGKSAQFPLHVWLPDAMEGPTPVSAMIHAATMVAAGVYLMGRSIVFLSPQAQLAVALVGSFTAIFAATIGICQTDIKRVLAYSTVSQLGYMLAAIGVGGAPAGLFHMVTHASFKACLFLGSGSVIHAVHSQEMAEMGGLRRKMPITYATMLASTLAIAGVPLFAGFYSKDAILAKSLERALAERSLLHALPAVFLFVAAGVTAFYMFRLIFLTFHGEPRDKKKFEHAHESPWTMTVPLLALGTLAVFVGSPWILNGRFFDTHPWFLELVRGHRLEDFVTVREPLPAPEMAASAAHTAHSLALFGSLGVAGLGILLATLFYQWRRFSATTAAVFWGPIYRWAKNKYYVDEFYQATVIRLTLAVTATLRWIDVWIVDGAVNATGALGRVLSFFSGGFDRFVVDGAVNGVGWTTQGFGALARTFQTGRVQQYVAFAVAGAVAVAAFVLMG